MKFIINASIWDIVRAVDYLCSMKEFDGSNLLVQGGSRGRCVSIVTAVLNPRVTGVVSFFPALSDLSGYEKGRAGGLHLFRDSTDAVEIRKKKLEGIFLL